MAIAAIVLVVIAITVAIFTGVVGDVAPFFKERTECQSQPAKETPECTTIDECDEKGGSAVYGLGCKDTTPYCCIRN